MTRRCDAMAEMPLLTRNDTDEESEDGDSTIAETRSRTRWRSWRSMMRG